VNEGKFIAVITTALWNRVPAELRLWLAKILNEPAAASA
jgi:hypothetical protein